MLFDRRSLLAGAAGMAALASLPNSALAEIAVAASESAGFTPAGMAALDAEFHALVDQKKLAGVTTLVARHGKVVHFDSYGRLDASAPAPVRHDSIFRLASMTKPIVGAAMMMLWEEGRWKLDDPVAKYIPQFADLKVKAAGGGVEPMKAPMTMRQIMSHSAGFDVSAGYAAQRLNASDLQGMIDKLAVLPLVAQPGTDWRYGPSVDIQGYIVEKLTGQGLDVFLKTRLFDPLGMVDTGFWVDAAKSARVARIHNYVAGVITPTGTANAFATSKPAFLSGSGGLFSTAEDYWKFCQMILNGGQSGGKRYLKADTVKLMHTNVLAKGVEVDLYSPDTKGLGFGLDFAIVQDPAAAKTSQGIQSFYWGGAFGTWFWIDPINDMIVIGMIQNTSGSTPGAGTPPCRDLSAQRVYAAMKDRKSA
jgi:CubicO group peptidase (beta-lactamase class C family)